MSLPADHLAQALTHHQHGNIEQALALYNEILAAAPNHVEALHLAAILHAQQSHYTEAQRLIIRALQLDASPTLHNTAGNIYKNLQQLETAIQHYRDSLKLQPNAAAHNNLATIYHRLEQFDNARLHYQAAITLNPQASDAYFNLGLIAQTRGELTSAHEYFTKTLTLDPTYAAAHYQLATISNNARLAIHHCQKTLRNARHHILAHHHLGTLLTHQGKLNQALRHFKKILSLDPHHLDSYHNIGSIFLRQKNPRAALKYFLHLVQLAPNFDGYYNLGVIYLDLGSTQDAITYFNEALKFNAHSLATYLNLAAIYLKKRDYPQAIHYYQRVQQIDPHHEEAQYLLAALTEKNADTAPHSYIQRLFDSYAAHFDRHLQLLDYQTPQLLCEEIRQIITEHNLSIVDLGCGTGLCGEKLHPFAARLVGIDLSPNMISLAKQKNLYHELHLGDITEKILSYRDVDLIVAADTLVYLGDLEPLIKNCHYALKPGGLLAFTVEQTEVAPYLLQKTARFAHDQKYIEELAKNHDFSIVTYKQIVARKQHGENVINGLFILRACFKI